MSLIKEETQEFKKVSIYKPNLNIKENNEIMIEPTDLDPSFFNDKIIKTSPFYKDFSNIKRDKHLTVIYSKDEENFRYGNLKLEGETFLNNGFLSKEFSIKDDFSKNHLNNWEFPSLTKELIKHSLFEIIEQANLNAPNLAPFYDSIFNELVKEKYNTNISGLFHYDFFDFLPMLVKDEQDEIYWYIPDLNYGEDILLPYEDNFPILNKRLQEVFNYNNRGDTDILNEENLFAELNIINLKKDGIEQISYTYYQTFQSDKKTKFNYTLRKIEYREEMDKHLYYLKDNNLSNNLANQNFFIKKKYISIQTTDLKQKYINTPVLTDRIIDIDKTMELLKELNMNDLTIEDIIQFSKDINYTNNLTNNKKINIPFVTYKIKQTLLEKLKNYSLTLFNYETTTLFSKEKPNITYQNIYNKNVEENFLENKTTIWTKDSEEIKLIRARNNVDRIDKISNFFIPLLSTDNIKKIFEEEMFTYKNILFTSKIFKTKSNISNVNNLFISKTNFPPIISKKIDLGIQNELICLHCENNEYRLLNLVTNEENIYNGIGESFTIKNFFNIDDVDSPNLSTIFLENRVLFIQRDKHGVLNKEIDEEKENFNFFEILKDDNGNVRIPFFIPLIERDLDFKISNIDFIKSPVFMEKNNNNEIRIFNFENKFNEYKRTEENFTNYSKNNRFAIYNKKNKNGKLEGYEIGYITIDLELFYKYNEEFKLYNEDDTEMSSFARPEVETSDLFYNLFFIDSIYNERDKERINFKNEFEKYKKIIKKLEIPFFKLELENEEAFNYFSIFKTPKNSKNNYKTERKIIKDKDNLHISIDFSSTEKIESLYNYNLNKNFIFFDKKEKELKQHNELFKILKKSNELNITTNQDNENIGDFTLLNDKKQIVVLNNDLIKRNIILLEDNNETMNGKIEVFDFSIKETKQIGEKSILEKGNVFVKSDLSKFVFDLSSDKIESYILLDDFSVKNIQNKKSINFSF